LAVAGTQNGVPCPLWGAPVGIRRGRAESRYLLALLMGGDEFGELGGEGAGQVPLADGPAGSEGVQGWDGDGADWAAGGICEPGQCGQDGVADAEFGEQGRGVPVGYSGAGGRGDAQACEALL